MNVPVCDFVYAYCSYLLMSRIFSLNTICVLSYEKSLGIHFLFHCLKRGCFDFYVYFSNLSFSLIFKTTSI
jgi:hypothetical protein